MKKQSNSLQSTDSYDYLGKAAAGMDCTGLIPSAPESEAELEAYQQLYPYLPPHTEKEKTTNKQE